MFHACTPDISLSPLFVQVQMIVRSIIKRLPNMAVLSTLVKFSAASSGLALLLGYLNIIKPFRFYGRVAVYILLIVFCAFLGTLEGIILSVVRKNGLVQWITARTFYKLCKIFLKITVEIDDPHNYLGTTRPAVFLSNHQSMLDILLLGATFPQWCSVTAKKALKWYPFLGWFMAASKAIFIDRASRTNALKAFEGARKEVLRDKQSIFMFPEGTRSYSDEPYLLPFKKGAFHFAQQAEIPIVPYVIANYSNIWSWKHKFSVPGTIKVKVLEPISTKGLGAAQVTALTENTRTKMLEVAKELGHATPASNEVSLHRKNL